MQLLFFIRITFGIMNKSRIRTAFKITIIRSSPCVAIVVSIFIRRSSTISTHIINIVQVLLVHVIYLRVVGLQYSFVAFFPCYKLRNNLSILLSTQISIILLLRLTTINCDAAMPPDFIPHLASNIT